ncbi:phosphotransferase family protein [Rhodococcus sp. T2V]|uniref:phosphotransferase family protein n=1 Tax=Rhodococcus sp. T2V TaxID=3034164 RepID=UPI0023E10ECC|nr:phosphotransferase family protein [Rhodococcus sp. T2V]MDF3312198.1 phosphotransferase family protein [Rhodococcus sp. T2V]
MGSDDRMVLQKSLELWLAECTEGATDVHLESLTVPKGTGNSAETMLTTMHYVEQGRKRSVDLVIRRQNPDSDLFLDTSIELPYRFMEALQRYPDIPSPALVGLELDDSILGSPFLVMRRVNGRSISQRPNYNITGWLSDLAVEDRRTVWTNAIRHLAALHDIDWRKDFGFLNDVRRHPEPGLTQYLAWVRDWYHWAKGDRKLPVADAALEWLLAKMPHNAEVSVLWGDPTPANILFGSDLSVAAIHDFEMAALGPGEVDLAWWLRSVRLHSEDQGIARLPGLPSHEETISMYEGFRKRAVSDLEYYDVLAQFRVNVVMIRFSDRLVAEGRMPGGTDVLTNNVPTAHMARMIGLDEPTPGEGYRLMMAGLS